MLTAIVIGSAAPAQARYASIVIDFESGRVLSEQGADERRHPASLTKMMTLFLIFEALDAGKITLNTRWNVSEYAAGQAPTKLNLQAGDRVAVRDIILGMVTRSANDAAMVAAEGLGGSEAKFADMMNKRAREIGMTRSNFENPHGLPNDGQITTVRDMATLGREIIKRYPHHYAFFSTQQFTFEGRKYANHNRLMNWYQGADGIKTGYIRALGLQSRRVGRARRAAHRRRRDRRAEPVGTRSIYRQAARRRVRTRRSAARDHARRESAARAQRRPGARASQQRHAEQRAGTAEPTRPSVRSRLRPSNMPTSPKNGACRSARFRRSMRRAAPRPAAQKIAPTYLSDATVDISEAGKRYRARLLGITQAQAREACRALDKREMDCMTLGPAQSRPSTRLADANSRRK